MPRHAASIWGRKYDSLLSVALAARERADRLGKKLDHLTAAGFSKGSGARKRMHAWFLAQERVSIARRKATALIGGPIMEKGSQAEKREERLKKAIGSLELAAAQLDRELADTRKLWKEIEREESKQKRNWDREDSAATRRESAEVEAKNSPGSRHGQPSKSAWLRAKRARLQNERRFQRQMLESFHRLAPLTSRSVRLARASLLVTRKSGELQRSLAAYLGVLKASSKEAMVPRDLMPRQLR